LRPWGDGDTFVGSAWPAGGEGMAFVRRERRERREDSVLDIAEHRVEPLQRLGTARGDGDDVAAASV
jgi:hypothetical protein